MLTLSDWKDVGELVQAIATTGGIVAAGCWTYKLFKKKRERYPRATITQQVTVTRITLDLAVLRVNIRVTNVGPVLLPVTELKCRLLQILPVAGSLENRLESGSALIEPGRQQISWPMLDDRTWLYDVGQSEIEPGEVEDYVCDFEVHKSVNTVQIYVHLANAVKQGSIGWACTKQLRLEGGETDGDRSTATGGEATATPAGSGEDSRTSSAQSRA
jgi:hypothetical protein